MKKHNFSSSQLKLQQLLSPKEDNGTSEGFYANSIKSFVQLRSYMPINPIKFPKRKQYQQQQLSEVQDIRQLFQQKQQLRKTLFNETKLHTAELHEYIGVRSIVEETEDKPKLESKLSSSQQIHYHNHTKQVINLMRNAHQLLSPVISRKNIEPNKLATEHLNFKQFSRLMRVVYSPLKNDPSQQIKNRTKSEFTLPKN